MAGSHFVDRDVFVAVNSAGVCDIHDFEVGREAEPVRSYKSIGDGADGLGIGLEPIDLTGQDRVWANSLMVAIGGIGEPDGGIVWVDDDVVDGVELAGMEGGDKGGALIWWVRMRDVDETARIDLAALCAVEEAVFVVNAAIPHAVWMVLWGGVVNAQFGWVIMIVDTGDFDELVGGGGVGLARREVDLVGGYEERVCRSVVDACFVEGCGGGWVLEKEVNNRIGAEEGVKFGVIGLEADKMRGVNVGLGQETCVIGHGNDRRGMLRESKESARQEDDLGRVAGRYQRG